MFRVCLWMDPCDVLAIPLGQGGLGKRQQSTKGGGGGRNHWKEGQEKDGLETLLIGSNIYATHVKNILPQK